MGFTKSSSQETHARTHTYHFRKLKNTQKPNFKMLDNVNQLIEPGKQFAKDSIRLIRRCTKPDKKEFQKIAFATAIGFAIMGFIGFFVKLVHIPINNIIVGTA